MTSENVLSGDLSAAPDCLPVVCADGLTEAMLAGDQCPACGRRWPRPEKVIGHTWAGRPVRVCEECEPVLEVIGG